MLYCSIRAQTEISNKHAVVIYPLHRAKGIGWWPDRIADKIFYMKYVVGMG